MELNYYLSQDEKYITKQKQNYLHNQVQEYKQIHFQQFQQFNHQQASYIDCDDTDYYFETSHQSTLKIPVKEEICNIQICDENVSIENEQNKIYQDFRHRYQEKVNYTIKYHRQDIEFQMNWAIKQQKCLKQMVNEIRKLSEKRKWKRNLQLYQQSPYKNQQFVRTIKNQMEQKFQILQKKQNLESQMICIFYDGPPDAVRKFEQTLNQYKRIKYKSQDIIQQMQIKLLILKEKSGIYDSKKLIPIILEKMRIADNNYFERPFRSVYK